MTTLTQFIAQATILVQERAVKAETEAFNMSNQFNGTILETALGIIPDLCEEIWHELYEAFSIEEYDMRPCVNGLEIAVAINRKMNAFEEPELSRAWID